MKENFYKRLKELSAIDETRTNSTPLSSVTLINFKRANDGTALGIIKENHNYYIKTSKVQGDKLTAADFAYIGGIENKRKYQYESLSKAEKQREYYMASLNEAFSLRDEKTTEEKKVSLNEATKLKIDGSIEEFLKNRISEGRKKITKSAEEKFKKNLRSLEKDHKDHEQTDSSIKKESQILTTADSQIVDDDIVVNKSNEKETPEAPINDKNAKTKANLGHGQPSDLVTSDSKINEDDEVDNKSVDAELDAAAKALDDLVVADASVESQVSNDEVINSSTSTEKQTTTSDINSTSKSNPNLNVDKKSDVDLTDKKSDVDLTDKKSDVDLNDKVDDKESDVKKVEKLTGKLDNAVRSTEITSDKAAALLNQIISSFSSKLTELDPEKRKEIANKILKTNKKEDKDMTDDETYELDDEANEAINSHVANLKENGFDDDDLDDEMSDLDDELGITPEDKKKAKAAFDADTGFNNYLRKRGYDPNNLEEATEDEIGSVVSNWASAHADGENDGDYKTVAIYLTPEIQKYLEDVGHGDFIKKLKAVVGEIGENQLAKFGSVEPMPDVKDNISDTNEDDDEKESKEKKEINFTPTGHILTTKSETNDDEFDDEEYDDVNDDDKKDEDEKDDDKKDKLKKYIKIKIEEKLGIRKPVLTEGKKTATAILIEKMIDEELSKLTEAELNEISLSGLLGAGKNIGSMVSGVGKNIGSMVSGAIQKAYSEVEQKVQSAANVIKAAGDEIVKSYHVGAKNDIIDDIEKMAIELGQLIAKLNASAVKAGEQPINPKSILATIQNQIATAKSQSGQDQDKPKVNLSRFRTK